MGLLWLAESSGELLQYSSNGYFSNLTLRISTKGASNIPGMAYFYDNAIIGS